MASNVTFFNPTDLIDINTNLSLTGSLQWILQTVAPSTTQDRASGLGATGDEAAYKDHNSKTQATLTYMCFGTSGNLMLPTVGSVLEGYHVDSVALAYNPTGWPTLTVTVHQHTTTSHVDAACNEYSTGIVFPAQFGVPASISDNTSPTPGVMFANGAASIGMRSLSFNLTCTHLDETGSEGDWLAGENHDGVETLDAEFTGHVDNADLTIAATWSKATDGYSEGNTAVNSRSISLVRHIARDA